MTITHFLYDERSFWHTTRDAVLFIPPQGNLQSLTSLGHVESAENKRRFLSLVQISGLIKHLQTHDTIPITDDQARLVHTDTYIQSLKTLSGQDMHIQDDFAPDYEALADLQLQPHQKHIIDNIHNTHPLFTAK